MSEDPIREMELTPFEKKMEKFTKDFISKCFSYFKVPEVYILSSFVNPNYEEESEIYNRKLKALEEKFDAAKGVEEQESFLSQYRDLARGLPKRHLPKSLDEIKGNIPQSVSVEQFNRAIDRLKEGRIIEDYDEKLKMTFDGDLVVGTFGTWHYLLTKKPPKGIDKKTINRWKEMLAPFS